MACVCVCIGLDNPLAIGIRVDNRLFIGVCEFIGFFKKLENLHYFKTVLENLRKSFFFLNLKKVLQNGPMIASSPLSQIPLAKLSVSFFLMLVLSCFQFLN